MIGASYKENLPYFLKGAIRKKSHNKGSTTFFSKLVNMVIKYLEFNADSKNVNFPLIGTFCYQGKLTLLKLM
jgi:hypothetical protein